MADPLPPLLRCTWWRRCWLPTDNQPAAAAPPAPDPQVTPAGLTVNATWPGLPRYPGVPDPLRELERQLEEWKAQLTVLFEEVFLDPHRLIMAEIHPQPVRDLLRAPGLRPAPVRSAAVATTNKGHLGAGHRLAVGPCDLPGETVGHIVPQSLAASLETFGRLARRSACHCAVDARYANSLLRVDALRRNSRDTVDGDRPSLPAIPRIYPSMRV